MKKTCPNEEKLGDYIEGILGEADRRLIEAHLTECDACRQELIIGNGLVRGGGQDLPPAPDNVTKSALDLIDNMVLSYHATLSIKIKRALNNIYLKFMGFMDTLPGWRWGLMPVRGKRQVVTEDLIHIKKDLKGISAEIDIEKIVKNNINIRIKLYQGKTNGNGIRVTLMKGNREVSSVLADENGHVLFDSIAYGHYSLIFKIDGKRLGEYLFEIKESDNGKR